MKPSGVGDDAGRFCGFSVTYQFRVGRGLAPAVLDDQYNIFLNHTVGKRLYSNG